LGKKEGTQRPIKVLRALREDWDERPGGLTNDSRDREKLSMGRLQNSETKPGLEKAAPLSREHSRREKIGHEQKKPFSRGRKEVAAPREGTHDGKGKRKKEGSQNARLVGRICLSRDQQKKRENRVETAKKKRSSLWWKEDGGH